MKKLIAIVCFFYFLGLNSFAQTVLSWVKGIGSFSHDEVGSMTVDNNENVYVAGVFTGTVDFDPSASTSYIASTGLEDAFVAKYDSVGQLIWVKKFCSPSNEYSDEVAIDDSGNIYIAGGFSSMTDFNPSPINTYYLTPNGNWDFFIVKLDNNGNFLWAKSFGGINSDWCTSLKTDHSWNVYLAGAFASTVDFDPSGNNFYLSSSGNGDAFVLKLNNAGNFIWATKMGGSGDDFVDDIEVDSYQNVFAEGGFDNTANFGLTNLVPAGYHDIFISKLEINGTINWARRIGGPGDDWGNGILLDNSGHFYITGDFWGTADFDPTNNISYLFSNGDWDIYVLKADTSGDLVWAHNFGGTASEIGFDLGSDAQGDIYVTGVLGSPTINFNGTTLTSYSGTIGDILTFKLSSTGNVIWAQNSGSSGDDYATSINVINNSIYIAGKFSNSCIFNSDNGTDSLNSNGNTDFFIEKLSQPLTSINEIGTESLFQIYPNPSHDIFNLKFSENLTNGKISVYNSLSQLILTNDDLNNESFTLDLKDKENGVYFIVFSSPKDSYSTKIILQH